MLHYIVEIGNVNGTADYHYGNSGGSRADQHQPTDFPGYFEAVQHIAKLLNAGNVKQPVEIHIVPVQEGAGLDEEWTIEDILRNAG